MKKTKQQKQVQLVRIGDSDLVATDYGHLESLEQ